MGGGMIAAAQPMTSAQAARHLAFRSTSGFKRRIRKVAPELMRRDSRGRYWFDPQELDSCVVRLSELPAEEAARVRPSELRFKKSEIDAWMTTKRLEFQSSVVQVSDAIRPLLPAEWPAARVAAVAAVGVGRMMGLDDDGDLPGFLFREM